MTSGNVLLRFMILSPFPYGNTFSENILSINSQYSPAPANRGLCASFTSFVSFPSSSISLQAKAARPPPPDKVAHMHCEPGVGKSLSVNGYMEIGFYDFHNLFNDFLSRAL